MANFTTYPDPVGLVSSTDFSVTIDDMPLFVIGSSFASFANFSIDKNVVVRITSHFEFESAKIRPLSKHIQFTRKNTTIEFTLNNPSFLSIEFDQNLRRPLLLFADKPEGNRPNPGDPGVRWFGPGLHTPGLITLSSNKTVYLEAGAVVRGCFRSEGADNIQIIGRGIIDGSANWEPFKRESPIILMRGKEILIEGITLFNTTASNINVSSCSEVKISGIKILAQSNSDDGIPVVGSHDVVIENCFIRTKDDCVTLKADERENMAGTGMEDVYNVEVKDCVLWNAEWGNALEIGYETRCECMHDIVFRNCDIIHCEYEGYESGGALTIHNGDRAMVRDVLYEDIRLEDIQEKLIDVKILIAIYTRDDKRGRIENIRYKNISVVDGPFPVSIIRGFGGNNDGVIRNISFENFTILGKKIADWREAHMVNEITQNVTFS